MWDVASQRPRSARTAQEDEETFRRSKGSSEGRRGPSPFGAPMDSGPLLLFLDPDLDPLPFLPCPDPNALPRTDTQVPWRTSEFSDER